MEPTVAALKLEPDPSLHVPACFPENTCGPEFSCPIEFDEDCDPQFCRLTGNQCPQTGGFGTFQRNEHVKYCWNAAGDFCIDADHGRYLVHCGC